MNGIGSRLREERERLGMTQRVFGDIGGVEPNAQGKYESGERTPKADYLAAVAARGVDSLYVLSGVRTPIPQGSLSAEEDRLLGCFRSLPAADQAAVQQLLGSLATALPGACVPISGHERNLAGRLSGK
ncbi:helix-turn-helix domain-containing protein [Pseudomonas sp. JQ170]|uniref:helix-turn-helix domain-containing protein n=1 Tax=unclassified Pseudomonas TaxID=196821 RepID=UPI002651B9C2|nr:MULTISPECIES: helix-turn-helix domain-containing protein [unclassified Pseudomonas]MDN7142024.1 helix-turn-helix domain-containing protein [Pseudomonas sp. JQ170]WRO78319.1 helix-turn-helix domain-containing protein [Pseudomonas sp. 170C]